MRCAPTPATKAAWPLPYVTITDAPRFRWRGAMLDVARHFLPKREVLRFLDLMALHKLNVLHFHLTDDQGWRVEIKRYPKLTEVGAWRGAPRWAPRVAAVGRPPARRLLHPGRHPRDRRLRRRAAHHRRPGDRHPRPLQAAIAAYPELGNQDVLGAQEPREVWTQLGSRPRVLNVEDATVEFYKNVLDEICDLFPGEFVCLGGDECPKDEWKASARAQDARPSSGWRPRRTCRPGS